MENKIYNYNGTDITFLSGNGDVLVNATQLAKPYGKRPNDYLSLPSTNQLIKAITRKYGSDENQLVRTITGGTHPGTWMHRLIVLDFCQWLDIDLKLWCTEKLDELMRYGMTATQPTLEAMVDNPDLVIGLAQKLKEERAEKQRLLELNEATQKQLEIQAPKVLFADSVSASHTSILIGDLAKILKQNGVEIGAKRLFIWMRRNGYLIKQPGMSYNMPSQRGMNLGLFEIKETVVTHADGHTSINKTVKVTGTGQIYFINKFLKQKELV